LCVFAHVGAWLVAGVHCYVAGWVLLCSVFVSARLAACVYQFSPELSWDCYFIEYMPMI
jgi:hypothetical protein